METDPARLARTSDPETSHEAAQFLQGDKLILQMLEFLYNHDRPQGWTAHEIELEAGAKFGGLCPWHRLSDLRRLGLAQWHMDTNGNPVRRPGPTPRTQRASVISVKGGQLYRVLRHYTKEKNGS